MGHHSDAIGCELKMGGCAVCRHRLYQMASNLDVSIEPRNVKEYRNFDVNSFIKLE